MNPSTRTASLAFSLLIAALLPACARITFSTKETTASVSGSADPRRSSPEAALAALKTGNQRFRAGKSTGHHDSIGKAAASAAHQYPVACAFTCADSRTSPEAIFDLGVGELFVCRVAGVASGVNDDASLEYGTAVLGAPLIVVMGHTNCGAMKAAIANKPLPGSLPKLVSQIRPAVEKAGAANPHADSSTLLAAATREQVRTEIRHLMGSPVIRKQVQAGKLKVVGAIYNLEDGSLIWL